MRSQWKRTEQLGVLPCDLGMEKKQGLTQNLLGPNDSSKSISGTNKDLGTLLGSCSGGFQPSPAPQSTSFSNAHICHHMRGPVRSYKASELGTLVLLLGAVGNQASGQGSESGAPKRHLICAVRRVKVPFPRLRMGSEVRLPVSSTFFLCRGRGKLSYLWGLL